MNESLAQSIGRTKSISPIPRHLQIPTGADTRPITVRASDMI